MRTKLLSSIARLVIKHPLWVIAIAAALTAVSIFLATTRLQMNTDQDDLVSEQLAYHKNYKNYLKEFGDLEYLYVVVEVKDNIRRAKEFTRALAARLEGNPDIQEVTYQISNPKLEKSFLLYIPAEQLEGIATFAPKMAGINSLADTFGMMNEIIGQPYNSRFTIHDSQYLETGFRFLDKLLDGMGEAIKSNNKYQPFLQQAFFGGDRTYDEDGFLLSENGNLMFIMIMPKKNYKTLAVIDKPLMDIRRALDGARSDFPDVHAGLTGRPVLAADEMTISNIDMTIATIAALIIVTLIFIAYFRRPTRPVMAAAALACGIAQTLGLTTVTIGHLNVLSIVFAVILVGAGIEFGLQIISRYREELAEHKDIRRAIEVSIIHTGRGNMTAALTTAAAFFAMCLSDFLALQELGFIAGAGILLCLANMLTTLPAMMFLRDRTKHPDRLHTALMIKLTGLKWIYCHPKTVLVSISILTLAAAPQLKNIHFNHNLLDLQARGLESVRYERKILEESSQSTWYVPFITESRGDSLALAERLRKLPSIGRVETIADIVPEGQEEKMGIISKLKVPTRGEGGTAALTSELIRFQKNLDHLTELAFSSGRTDAVLALEDISGKVKFVSGGDGAPSLKEFERSFVADLKRHIDILKSGLNPEPILLGDMPSSIQKRFVSPTTGRYAIYAYPKEDVWKPEHMEGFIRDVRSIDPNVTGTPVEVYESSKLLERSFKQAAIFAMIFIVLVVAVDFKSLKYAALALLPLALGVLWLLELMGLFGIRFNLANFFGVPILLGVGVDNAVQIIHRHRFEKLITYNSVIKVMTRSTGIAVLLTSITTLASFGTLTFAHHQGIASLGAIMALGTITCFVGSMILLPCVLEILTNHPSRNHPSRSKPTISPYFSGRL